MSTSLLRKYVLYCILGQSFLSAGTDVHQARVQHLDQINGHKVIVMANDYGVPRVIPGAAPLELTH